jgi:hypothetical protein
MFVISSAVILGIFAFLFQSYMMYLFRGLPYQKGCPFENNFSDGYYEAREKFRRAVQEYPSDKMVLHTLALTTMTTTTTDDDLTIDIGVLRRSSTKMMIHVSGTHGVEGFAGSAVQHHLLESLTKDFISDDDSLPTLIFVHALNPFGFANLRRFNEHNVDLNRNYLSESEFKEAINQDPNHASYVDFMELMNPEESFETRWDFFYIRVIQNIFAHGYTKIKEALVSGNYHFPNTIFYGGTVMEQSHSLLRNFLSSEFDVNKVDTVGLIDLHTGLGPSGFDTIVLHDIDNDEGKKIFGGSNNEFVDRISKLHSVAPKHDADKAMSGYGKVIGSMLDGLPKDVFPSNAKMYPVTQEFGTVPGVLVFKAIRAENTMYQYDSEHRLKYAEDLRDVFYLKKNPVWKTKVIIRGEMVFNQLYARVSNGDF